MAKKDAEFVKCPFVILVDKNESLPQHDGYKFTDPIASNADTGEVPFLIETRTVKLDFGDYSAEFPDLGPWEQPRIVVERKTKADLYGSVAKRENFEWRLNQMCIHCEHAVVAVEAEFSDLMTPPRHTNYTFRSLNATIQSWQQRFQKVHWCFYPNRDISELATFWHLYRFYENLTRHKGDFDRRKSNYAAYLRGMHDCQSKKKTNECPFTRKHRYGDDADFWMRGYLDFDRAKKGHPLTTEEDPHERHIIMPEYTVPVPVNQP